MPRSCEAKEKTNAPAKPRRGFCCAGSRVPRQNWQHCESLPVNRRVNELRVRLVEAVFPEAYLDRDFPVARGAVEQEPHAMWSRKSSKCWSSSATTSSIPRHDPKRGEAVCSPRGTSSATGRLFCVMIILSPVAVLAISSFSDD